MKNFDDRTSGEMEPENQVVIALLSIYTRQPGTGSSAEQAQIIARARARLLQTAYADIEDEDAQWERIISQPRNVTPREGIRRKSPILRMMNVVAAVIIIGVLLGTSLLLFAHHSPTLSRKPISPKATAKATPHALQPCLFGFDTGLIYVCQHHLYQDIFLSKSMGNYTVTIEQAFADANRIVFFSTVREGTVNVSKNVQATMTLISDQVANLSQGTSYGFKQGVLTSFNIYQYLGSDASDLRLQLEIQKLSFASGEIAASPIVFNLSVAFNPERRIRNMQQRAVVSGIPLTLIQSVVSLSAVSFTFTYDQQTSLDFDEMALSANGENCSPLTGLDGNGMYIIDFACPLFQKHGVWTISIAAMNLPRGTSPGKQLKPWTFHVEVP